MDKKQNHYLVVRQQAVHGSHKNCDAPRFGARQRGGPNLENSCEKLENAALETHRLGMQVNAGHGLTYQNTQQICHLPHLKELNIGHSIVCRAVIVGFGQAVREMRELINHQELRLDGGDFGTS